MVAVWMVTYNHGEFIENAIESVMMQKSTFKYKLFIGEDCSTDKTREICKKLKEKYAYKIELILHKKNIGANPNGIYMYKRCFESGAKYVAMLEGDDYWTDPYKLQKQVDFLEANSQCKYLLTNRYTLKPDGAMNETEYNLPELFDLHFLLKQNIMPSTQTALFRNAKLSLLKIWEELLSCGFNGDWILLFMITQNGKIGFLKDKTAVYREGIGVISKTSNVHKFINGLKTNKQINLLTNYEYSYHIGVYDFHYQNITYSYLENKEKLKGILWFFKTEFYKLFNAKSESFFTKNNWIFIKHSFKLLVKTN